MSPAHALEGSAKRWRPPLALALLRNAKGKGRKANPASLAEATQFTMRLALICMKRRRNRRRSPSPAPAEFIVLLKVAQVEGVTINSAGAGERASPVSGRQGLHATSSQPFYSTREARVFASPPAVRTTGAKDGWSMSSHPGSSRAIFLLLPFKGEGPHGF
jgi:hypothetical protein